MTEALNNLIRHNLNYNSPKLDLGVGGLDKNHISGVDGFQLFSTGIVETTLPIIDARTAHLWNHNNKVFRDIEAEFGVKARHEETPLHDMHKYLFTVDALKEAKMNTEDKTPLRGLTAKIKGIPDMPDIKLETSAINELHLNTRTGKYKKVTANEIQASNARNEDDEATEKFIAEYKAGRDKIYIDMESGVKKKTKVPSDKSVDDMENGKSKKVFSRKLLPPIVRPALPPKTGGGGDPKNFQ